MNLYELKALKAFLAKHDIVAAKGLGQHFLCSGPVVLSIVASLSEMKGVLEIGPGPGVLTSPLSEKAEKVIALEVDDRMISALKDSAPRADVRKVDALEVNLAEILDELPEPRGIVSNLPYYITGPLLAKVEEAKDHVSIAVLMMQKEVALRIAASPGNRDRGAMSVALQAQFEIRTLIQVPGGAFLPPPKVDSTVLSLTPKHETPVEKSLLRMIKLAFAQPRKTLANNLANGLHIPRDRVLDALLDLKLGESVRPQELNLDEWKALAAALE